MLAITSTQTARGQAPANPYAMGFPAQHALYQAPPAAPSGVHPAAFAMMPGASVQQVSCPSCGPGGGGEVIYGDPEAGAVAFGGGCDSGMCGPGMCGPGGCGPAGGGLGGLHQAMHGFGEHLAGGDGYNGQHFGQAHGPYGSGGCCQPRTFDVQAEWLFWRRDYDAAQPFSSDGILGPTVLDANMLDYNEESGFRVTGAYLIGPSTTLEAGYFGGFNYADSATVTGNGSLFSVFSNFGSDPFNGFIETGFGDIHSLAISSEMDNAELNLRRRWVSANCIVHSSMLVGARYFRLREDLVYATTTSTDAMEYVLKTDNDLVGAQIGGDMYFCITPRLRVGGEIEAGVYGTGSRQRTNMTSTASPSLQEYVEDNDVAFIGEGGVSALYRINSHWSVKAGYQVLFIDGVATAVDNFNTQSPFAARTAFLDNNGDAFFHGATLGFEWTR
jgi:hypothetical protein